LAAAGAQTSTGVGIGWVVAGVAALAGAAALADNSFLTHLATGRLILDGDLPRADPYTFTAAGESWIAQSWLASVLYAGAEELGGLGGIRLLMAATTAVLGALTWALTAGASPLVGRLLVFAPAFVAGFDAWSERPLLLGLAALGVTLLAAEGRVDPRWLVPVGWVWVNVHGSWPLGFVALACLAAGRRLDGERPEVELRAGAWLLGGTVLAAVNPYGPALLVFPLQLLSRRESLSGIVEWGPMTFDSVGQWAFLALVVVGIVAVTRRPSWRATVPLVVFAAAALTGLRNVPVAALVLLPGAAAGMGGIGSLRVEGRSAAGRPLALAGVALLAVSAVSITRSSDFDDEPYPVAAATWLEDNGLGPAEHRIVARELVGNWFEARYGATGQVFIDDRIEVIPVSVVRDHRALLAGDPGWQEILERYEPAAVLWESESPLAALLDLDEAWEIAYRDDAWVVAVPADR
jgi:hypothetical protein